MTLRSILLSATTGALVVVPSYLAVAQELQITDPNREVLCPHPARLHVAATATPSIDTQHDFTQPLPAGQGVRPLGGAGVNQIYRNTFHWKVSDRMCCEITRATLTAKVRWNGHTGPSTASNDTLAIVSANATVGQNWVYVWTNNRTAPYSGTNAPTSPATITLNLDPAALALLNANQRISMQVQDDTTVESAELELGGCCLGVHK